jgi:hypothetical protein
MLEKTLKDRKSRIPRIWSNAELKKFAHMFEGDVVNVSGWRDEDKEGSRYADYFTGKSSYTITNFVAEARGMQGYDNELFLDLTRDLPSGMRDKFDVVFNHTVLEHVFEVHKALENLCLMSRDIVILVVPFLQPMHADYGDYWRFTPLCLQKLFEQNGLKVLYCSFNNHVNASTYVFCVASKNPEKWKSKIITNLNGEGGVEIFTKAFIDDGMQPMAGANAIFNAGPWIKLKYSGLRKFLSDIRKKAHK